MPACINVLRLCSSSAFSDFFNATLKVLKMYDTPLQFGAEGGVCDAAVCIAVCFSLINS